jgi:hypothetical protein
MTTPPKPANPFVGPRAFTEGETRFFFGRERETRDLFDLLLAERIVLMCSPSGAGKSSLIEAGLKPLLRQEGFLVHPTMRVSLSPRTIPDRANRYILSLLLCLEGQQAQSPASVEEIAGMSLTDYLNVASQHKQLSRAELPEQQPVEFLIFDQFEEILTLDPSDEAGRVEFFEQLGAALRQKNRWALFAMREEYRISLDPYLRPVPTRLSTVFRLDRLNEQAALKAIQKPAESAGIHFSDEAARKLIDDLRRIRVQSADGQTREISGQYVEPVQLQVVCHNIWEKLPAGTPQIDSSHIEHYGSVSNSLAEYYAQCVGQAAGKTEIPERQIRDWVGENLICESGIRNQILLEAEESAGLSNKAIDELRGAYLIRAEERRGTTWLELSHDRLVEPVRSSNRQWFEANLSLLQRQSRIWDERNRPDNLLLRGSELEEAEIHATRNPNEMSDIEEEFLKASHKIWNQERLFKKLNYAIAAALIATFLALTSVAWLAWRYKTKNDALKQEHNALKAAQTKLQKEKDLFESQKEELAQIIKDQPPMNNSGSDADSADTTVPVTSSPTPLPSPSVTVHPTPAPRPPVSASPLPAPAPTVRPDLVAARQQMKQTSLARGEVVAAIAQTNTLRRGNVTVQYFQKDVDQGKVDAALKSLSFTLDKTPATESMQDTETNCVWYGSQVSPEDAKLVAFALIRAGVSIKSIRSFRITDRPQLIQIGSNKAFSNDKPLTVEQIRACKLPCP